MSRHSPAGVGTSPSAIPIVDVNRGGLEQTLDRIDPIVLRRYLDQLPSPAVGTGTLRPSSSRSNVPAGQGTLTGGPHQLNQDDMQRQLQMLFNDQRQVAAGRRIAGITTTNTITTTYKDGGRPTVRRTSTRWCHASLNALALFIVAAGVIAGSLTENSVIVACLTSAGTVVKGWNDFKKYSFKVDVCRFAYTSYDKTLIELRTYARGLPMDELEGFLIKMQTLDDTITDFTPPVADKYVQAYERQHDKSEDVDRDDDRTMRRKKRVTQRRRRAGRRRIGQKGGILPLAALIPALIAGGKAIALGAASGAAGWGAKKALDAATRKKKR
ncbi:hypothetical protein ACROYT_G023900 [Oculina patagonica]